MSRVCIVPVAALMIACGTFAGVAAPSAERGAYSLAQAEEPAPPAGPPAAPSPDEGGTVPQDTSTQDEGEKWGGWPLLLLLPGVLGLWVAAGKEWWQRQLSRRQAAANAEQRPRTPPVEGIDNRFFIAAVAATIWLLTLGLMTIWVLVRKDGGSFVSLFHEAFGFYLLVPVLGFVGALLYVLDLSRRGREDIPKGTEFGMRLVMGPYVAIVMVWFAEDIGFLNAGKPGVQGTLAFVSGLLVVIAFQALVEKGQEVLGGWREKATYAPSDIARAFNLTKEDDLQLRRADLRSPIQLTSRSVDSLKADAKRFGIDEDFLLTMRREAHKGKIRESIGPLAWGALERTVHVQTVEDFAHLSDEALDETANGNEKIRVDGLKQLRDTALELCTPSQSAR